ncbi:MAG: hypothetical protein SFZ23_10860 [Planctomycetota bacterium]|nr:hypothetical protein [Planctomycetota bacterium]
MRTQKVWGRILKLGGLASLLAGTSALAQPANNACSNATVISGPGTFAGTTVGATNDGIGSCGSSGGSPDVWYRFTLGGTAAKELRVTTCGLATWDTVLSLHTACGAAAVECNDDDNSCGLRSTVARTLQPNDTVLIRVAGFSGATGTFSINVSVTDPPPPPPPPTAGPDVTVLSLSGTTRWGAVGNITAYSVGTTSCNRGDAPVLWIASTNAHPAIAQNMYRYKNDRLEQIGMSWLKHGFVSVNGDECGTCVDPPMGGSQLGVNCSDPYGASLNGDQARLGPRSHVNATAGTFPYPFTNPGAGYITPPAAAATIGRRLQVLTADIDPAQNANARYFVEGQYATADDAQFSLNGRNGNGLNNASSREIVITSATSSPSSLGGTFEGQPAILRWPGAQFVNADYLEGSITSRFIVASKVVDNGNGTWTYNYGVFNLNSHRNGASFGMNFSNVNVTNPGFRDVFYHSGDPYNGIDWAFNTSNGASWACTETATQNPNANALRWGTMYTFWFTANTPPTTGAATIGLFAAGSPSNLTVQTQIPTSGQADCPADFNGDGQVDFFDYLDFAAAYGDNDPTADFNGDQQIDFFDYLDFVVAYDTPCE